MTTGLAIFDCSLRCVEVNQAFADASGLPLEEHPGRALREIAPWFGERGEHLAKAALDSGVAQRDCRTHGLVSMPDRCLEARFHALRDENQHLLGVGLTLTDVPAEALPAESKHHLAAIAAIAASTHEAVYSADRDDRIITWNAGAERLYGYSADEILGKSGSVLVPADLQLMRQVQVTQVLSGVQLGPFETQRVTRDGRRITVSMTATPIRRSGDEVVGTLAVARDLAEHRAAEDALRRSEERYRGLVEDQPDLLIRMLPDGTLTFVNRHCAAYFGVVPEQLIGTSVLTLLPEAEASAVRQMIGELSVATPVATFVHAVTGADSVRRWHQWTNRGLFDSDGRLIEIQGIGRDISELKRVEAFLEESRDHLQAVIDAVGDPIFVKDESGTYTRVNQAFAALIGRDCDEIVGQSDLELLPPAVAEVCMGEDQRALADPRPHECEELYQTPDGGQRVLLNKRSVLPRPDGSRFIVGVIRDVTDRLRAETALRESEERFRSIAAATSDAVWDWNLQHDTLWWGAGIRALFGYDPETLEPTIESWHSKIHPDDRDWVIADVRGVIDGGGSEWSATYRYRRADGTYADVSDRGYVIRTEDGRPVRMVGGLCDVTERTRAETALREREAILSSIVTASPDLISVIGRDGVTISVSPAMEEVLGFPAEERAGKPVTDRIHPDDAQRVQATIQRAFMSGAVERVRHRYQHRDGRWRTLDSWGRAVPEPGGEPRYLVAISRDVTESVETQRLLATANVELEDALRRAREAADLAEEANRAKSQFLATMSHEIRTPLNGIIGMTSLLLDAELSSDARDHASVIRSSGEALLSIINDILDFSKIDAGRMDLEVSACDPAAIAEEVAGLLATDASVKGIDLRTIVEIPPDTRFLGDAGRVRQVLMNLVGNAVKFTAAGGVTVEAYIVADDPESQSVVVRFNVRDTGVGIPPEVIERLFTPFVQADSSTTRRFGGTGLGLAISKRLAELLGGEIGVESEVGVGSLFWVTVRLTRDQESEVSPSALRVIRGRRVLVVGDDAASRQALRQQLVAWGLAVTSAGGVTSAAETVSTITETATTCHAVILDYHRSTADAYQVVRAIRAARELDDLRIVLLTALGEQVPQEVAGSVNANLVRPVRPSLLHGCLADLWLGKRPGSKQPSATVARMSNGGNGVAHGARILVAEDNIVNQKVAGRILERLGYQVDLVANGREAVDALRRVPYAAVLMDCQMPVMDGYEATETIRAGEPRDRHTPIIALTASAMQGDREACLQAGMDDYVSKPIRPDDLTEVLTRWVTLTDQNAG